MTVREALATFRKTIEESNATSDYTNSYLWSVWSAAKMRVWRNKKVKGQFMSAWNYHRFCIGLERVNSHDCECVSVGCTVLRTKFQVPKPLTGRVADAVEVTTLSGKRLGYRSENQVKSDLLDDIKKNDASFGVYNQYLYVWNNLDYKAIQLNAPWENIIEWEGIQHCDDGADCINIYDLETGVSREDEEDILKIGMEILGLSLQKPADVTSDRNADIKV